MTRYTIDPAQFTDSQWEELYNASSIMPRSMEAKRNAKAFKRPKKHIQLAILCLANRADHIRDRDGDTPDTEAWAQDLENAAETLQALIGPKCELTKAQAKGRLYDILTSDIYTDAPEYASRVAEIHELLPLVLGVKRG